MYVFVQKTVIHFFEVVVDKRKVIHAIFLFLVRLIISFALLIFEIIQDHSLVIVLGNHFFACNSFYNCDCLCTKFVNVSNCNGNL